MGLTVAAALRAFGPTLPVAVAFSGGADSTALLLAAARAWPGSISAIHVHHGLQAAADHFAQHCRQFCDQLGVPFHQVNVDARHESGESPEDAARKARYTALAQVGLALGVKAIWLGHHADDQVETLLLALSRGAGLPGLAAMPARFERHGMRFERPLLGVGGTAIREWLRDEGVGFIEDPTNDDRGFTRNRIRHELLPALERAFPQFRETFARSARHAAQAQRVLSAVAAEDLARTGNPPSITALRMLDRARQANLLRHWLLVTHQVRANTAQLDELMNQVAACSTRGHDIRIKVGSGFVERNGDALGFRPHLDA